MRKSKYPLMVMPKIGTNKFVATFSDNGIVTDYPGNLKFMYDEIPENILKNSITIIFEECEGMIYPIDAMATSYYVAKNNPFDLKMRQDGLSKLFADCKNDKFIDPQYILVDNKYEYNVAVDYFKKIGFECISKNPNSLYEF